jgi:branched-chain amino acid aminotransferase
MEKSQWIWLDGELVPWDEARVHVLTHTLHYGLGVFEGIRCYDGELGPAIFRLQDHTDRLLASAHILGIAVPFSAAEINAACVETVRANRLRSCYIRPLAFIGDGEMGLSAKTNKVRLTIAAWPWGSYLGDEGVRNGIRVHTSSYQRFHVNSLMSKAKAVGHYVNSILASTEARRSGYDEALLLDTQGFVAEGSGENLFIVRRGVVKTPPLTSALSGITRDTVMKLLADRGVTVVEQFFTRDEVYIADEAFFTGTAAEITPVRELDDRQVGPGHPGPITREVQAQYDRVTRGAEQGYREWVSAVGHEG